MQKITYILTHPIQYYAPLFKYMHESGVMDCEVWYLTDHGVNSTMDAEFGVQVKWDIPLLEGYPFKFIRNNSWKPGIYTGFFGMMNFDLIGHLRSLPKKSIVIVPGWNNFSFILSIIAGRLLGHIVCLRAETSLIQEMRKNSGKREIRKVLIGNILFSFFNKFFYIGQKSKALYKYFGVADHKLLFTPYAVNNAFFSGESERLSSQRNELRQKWGIPLGKKVILFSGKLIDIKNPLLLLRAFHNVSDKTDAALVYMGEGALRKEIEQYVQQHDMKNVFISGFINQSSVSEFYSLADIYVLCSFSETWGLSTNEAMNFGLPVILSDAVGCAHDLVDGNGYMFKSDDVEDLTAKLFQLLTAGKDEFAQMQRRSLEIIDNYSYREIVNNLQQLEAVH